MLAVVDDYRTTSTALLRDPNDVAALVDMFALLADNGQPQDVAAHMVLAKRAFALSPEHPRVIFNYATALSRLGGHNDAILLYLKCLPIDQRSEWRALVLYHIALGFRSMGEWEKALDYYAQSLALDPQSQVRVDQALTVMGAGRLNEGLRLFEARKELAEIRDRQLGEASSTLSRLPPGVVHWNGEDLRSKSITVYQEEGVGDFFMFCRFLPQLQAAKIFLTGRSKDLLEFVSDHIPVEGILPLEGPFNTDYVTGSMSVPWRTRVEWSDIIGEPYFHVEPAMIPRRGRLNVGLCWRGSPGYKRDHLRSMPFREFVPLFDMTNAAFYSLQIGPATKEDTRGADYLYRSCPHPGDGHLDS